MNIAIIGAGNVGRALATQALRSGHQVVLAALDPGAAKKVAEEIGAGAAESNGAAAQAAEIVILAVPNDARAAVVEGLRGELEGKVLVELSNRPTPDPEGATGPLSAAEEIQALVPEVPVVKAFNTVLVSRQVDPVISGVALDGYVAADDPEARQKVLDLVGSMGLVPFDAGPLMNARTLEGMAWLNIRSAMRGGGWESGWKLLRP